MSLLCRVCGNALGHSIFSGRLCGDTADYFDFLVCGYVQTQPPTWLDRAYAHPINRSDTGVMVRNRANCRIILATLALLGRRRERVLDCAGGYGIFVRMLRDRSVDARWSDRYCENLLARGFEHDGHPAGLATAFEAFEHFTDPTAWRTARLVSRLLPRLYSTGLKSKVWPDFQAASRLL